MHGLQFRCRSAWVRKVASAQKYRHQINFEEINFWTFKQLGKKVNSLGRSIFYRATVQQTGVLQAIAREIIDPLLTYLPT